MNALVQTLRCTLAIAIALQLASTAAAAPPPGAAERVEEWKQVVAGMPDHPLSREALAYIMGAYVPTPKDPCVALLTAAEDFANEDLGLYALDVWRQECPGQDIAAVLADLLSRAPDTRLGARIVDLLADATPDAVAPKEMLAKYPGTRAAAQAVIRAAGQRLDASQPEDALRLALGALDVLPPTAKFPYATWSPVLSIAVQHCGLTVLDRLSRDLPGMPADEARLVAEVLKEVLSPLLQGAAGTVWNDRKNLAAMQTALAGDIAAAKPFAALQLLGLANAEEDVGALTNAMDFLISYCGDGKTSAPDAAEIAFAARQYLHESFDARAAGDFDLVLRANSDRMTEVAVDATKRFAAMRHPADPAALPNALRPFLARSAETFAKEFRFLAQGECLRLLLANYPQDDQRDTWLADLGTLESNVYRNHAEAAGLQRKLWSEDLPEAERPAAALREVRFLYLADDFRAARALVQRYLVAAPDKQVRDEARVYEILCEFRMGDIEKTKFLINEFTEHHRDSIWYAHVLVLRAYILMFAGQYPDALKTFAALEQIPLDPERQRKVREMLNDLAEATELAQQQPAVPPAKPSPNIVLISLDTTRPDRLGCYGNTAAKTPNIDALAAEGTVFERAYSTASWTKPAHASLMTGRYPLSNGAQGYDDKIAPKAGVLAEWLKEQGYTTIGTVSAPPLNSIFGFGRGFDAYDDNTYEFDRICNIFLRGNDGPVKIHSGATSKLMTYVAMMTFNRLVTPDRPYFYFMNYFDAHHDYQPIYPFNAESRAHYYGNDWGMIDQWTAGPEPFDPAKAKVDRDRLVTLYDEEIAAVDAELWTWTYRVKMDGRQDNTIWVIFGDHGEEFLEHGNLAHGHGLNEEVIHVPLIICGPGVPKGKRISTPVSLVDIAPTLMELIGQVPPPGLDGKSLVPLLKGETPEPRPLFASMNLKDFQGYAVIDGNDKIIANTRDNRITLSDLATDPGETRDIGAMQPQRMKQLVEFAMRLQDAQRQSGLALGAGEPVTKESLPSLDALVEQFRSMGYLGK